MNFLTETINEIKSRIEVYEELALNAKNEIDVSFLIL